MTATASPPDAFHAASFRDPDGRVFQHAGRIYRALSATMRDDWVVVSNSQFFRRRINLGEIVDSHLLSQTESAELVDEDWAAVLAHETLPFIAYPYEWSFGMLQTAAILQLELLQEALLEDLVLKDATPYNVQFRGAQAVFIDVGSFSRYVPGAPWAAYRQFCMMFLYPLLLQAHRQIDFQPWLRGALAGISPAQCRSMFSWADLWRRGLLTHVFLHAAMDRHVRVDDAGLSTGLRRSGFDKSLILNNVRGLLKLVSGLRWRPSSSPWSEYDVAAPGLGGDVPEKEDFVRRAASQRRWRLVWDLGCNVGRYSRIAAEHADFVVAIDGDAVAVERLYQDLRAGGSERILPLRINLADPSPSQGWRGCERTDLADRGKPELVLCLAVLHHLVLGENLPLLDVVDWLADLGASLVIEYVDRDDPQVRKLLAQRSDGGHAYTQALFESALAARFRVREQRTLSSATRTLYFVEPM